MLIRERVGASVRRVIPPQARPTRAQIWAMGEIIDRQTSTGAKIYVSHEEETCTRAQGVPLPTETPVEIDLEPGQALWATAADDGFLSISILER